MAAQRCLLACGWVKLREVGAGSKQFVKQWKPPVRGAAYTHESAFKLVVEYFKDLTSSGDVDHSAVLGDRDGGSSSSIVGDGDAKDDLPAVRNRKQTTLFEPMEKLRDCASGERKEKRAVGECCDSSYCKKARAELEKAQVERDALRERAETAAAALRELKAESCRCVEALEEELQPGAAALQQAVISLLAGREECVVRLRLVPGDLRASKLSVVVYDPAEDTEQDREEATAEEEPAPPPHPPPPPRAGTPECVGVHLRL